MQVNKMKSNIAYLNVFIKRNLLIFLFQYKKSNQIGQKKSQSY